MITPQKAARVRWRLQARPQSRQALADAHTFSAWGGFALFCGYTAAALAIAAVLLVRRDT